MSNQNKQIINLSRGYSLVELMIAMTIGLLVIAATLSIFFSNKETYRASDNISRVQESARTAFEFMSRDIRESTGTLCDFGIVPLSVLNNSGGFMWRNWTNPMMGYDNGALAGSLAGTDAFEIKTAGTSQFDVTTHNAGTNAFNLNTAVPHDIVTGDIVIACDFNRAAIFQVSGVAGSVISHASGGAAPGNSTASLGTTPTGPYTFIAHATLSRVNATQWFVAANGRGGNSLFRNTLRTTAGVPAMVREEVAEGIRDLQITYLLKSGTTFVNALPLNDPQWSNVIAVRIVMTIEGNDRVSTTGQRLTRTISQTINLRNRNQ